MSAATVELVFTTVPQEVKKQELYAMVGFKINNV